MIKIRLCHDAQYSGQQASDYGLRWPNREPIRNMMWLRESIRFRRSKNYVKFMSSFVKNS